MEGGGGDLAPPRTKVGVVGGKGGGEGASTYAGRCLSVTSGISNTKAMYRPPTTTLWGGEGVAARPPVIPFDAPVTGMGELPLIAQCVLCSVYFPRNRSSDLS